MQLVALACMVLRKFDTCKRIQKHIYTHNFTEHIDTMHTLQYFETVDLCGIFTDCKLPMMHSVNFHRYKKRLHDLPKTRLFIIQQDMS